jgi:hypothetical protein
MNDQVMSSTATVIVMSMDTLTDRSTTLYLVPLFTFVYLQTFTLLPLPQYQYLAIPQ